MHTQYIWVWIDQRGKGIELNAKRIVRVSQQQYNTHFMNSSAAKSHTRLSISFASFRILVIVSRMSEMPAGQVRRQSGIARP